MCYSNGHPTIMNGNPFFMLTPPNQEMTVPSSMVNVTKKGGHWGKLLFLTGYTAKPISNEIRYHLVMTNIAMDNHHF